jgi:nucleotide-binding universal stress UspA family protein
VCAWEVPALEYLGAAMAPTPDLAEEAKRRAEEVLSDALADIGPDPGVLVETAAVAGHAPEVLVEQSREATLLVVGSRGHGGLASLVLGSVSQAVAHRCHSPLAIVPHRS